MGKGADDAEIAERIRLHPDYGTPTNEDIQTAIDRAARDLRAFQAVRRADPDRDLRLTAVPGGTYTGTVGVRVVFTVQHPTGQMGNASVVVNVSGNSTIDEVLQAVRDFVANGGLRGHTHRMYGAEAIDAYVGAIAIGGYQNALIPM